MNLFISQKLLNDLANINACSQLSTNKVSELFTYKNKKYIILGSISTGANGTSKVTAYEVTLLQKFSGKAVSYAQYGFDIMDGKAKKGYYGVTFKNKKIDWVITGDSTDFLPIGDNQQLEFF